MTAQGQLDHLIVTASNLASGSAWVEDMLDLVGSPSIWWHDHALTAIEGAYADSHDDLPARVTMSVGADEPPMMLADIFGLEQQLRSRHYPSLQWSPTRVHAGETHNPSVPAFTTAASLALALRAGAQAP